MWCTCYLNRAANRFGKKAERIPHFVFRLKSVTIQEKKLIPAYCKFTLFPTQLGDKICLPYYFPYFLIFVPPIHYL